MPVTDPSYDPGADLIAQLAMRVAEARKARGMPRRVLSELSGVSPRYLAQLEAGEGNISILLLQRVAAALDLKVGALLAEDVPLDHDVQRVVALFRQAPLDVQQKVRSLLAPQNPDVMRAGRICLIGLRGAGKSTLGKLAGEALNIPFVELNKDIEAETDMPLAEVMALYGQDGYREMEAEALERVSARHDRVILAVELNRGRRALESLDGVEGGTLPGVAESWHPCQPTSAVSRCFFSEHSPHLRSSLLRRCVLSAGPA